MGFPILSTLIALPAIAGLVLLVVGRSQAAVARWLALVVTLAELALALVVWVAGDPTTLVERAAWFPALGVEYRLAVDGISMTLVLLTALLGLVAVVAGWDDIGTAGPLGLLLLLEAAVTGAFLARDLILFFVFWEAMLIPMVLLISIYGGPRRGGAAMKFFLYTTFGSLLMLVGVIALALVQSGASGRLTFDLETLARSSVPTGLQSVLFLAFALAFAIKTPIFPLHTWIADTYEQAPAAVLVFATMLVKVGAYGFLRFCLPLFPQASASFAPLLGALAVVGIVYGGITAFAQRDAVRLLAYSSLAHLGFVVLGIFSLNVQGIQGAVLQMVNHGISAGALFLIVAFVARRTGTANLDELGGLAQRWPVLAGFTLLAAFSSLGLPGLNGFVGELLILLGAFQMMPTLAVIAVGGVILAAVYLLTLVRKAFHGPATAMGSAGPDLTARETVALAPLAVLIVVLGLFPNVVLGRIESPTTALGAVIDRPHVQVQQHELAVDQLMADRLLDLRR